MNTRLTWNSTLETGVRMIDLQHQELIELINELEIEHEHGRDDAALKNILPRLTAYVLFHFSTEEDLMANVMASDPHAIRHVEEHREFAEKVALFKTDRCIDPIRTLVQLLAYLRSWLVEHIMSTDKELGEYILSRGHQHRAAFSYPVKLASND